MNPEHLRPLSILVADDTRTNLRLLEVFLSKLGHRIFCAENGQEAVSLFKQHTPDLVLLDIMMPVMDGFAAAKEIKAASHLWVPVIFLSALDRDQNLLAGLEAGGDDYLAKPINFVILEAKLRSVQRALYFQTSARETRDRLQKISDSIFDAIVTMDRNGRIIACNRATELVFQWSTAEMLGRNVGMLMPEPIRSEHDMYLRQYLQGGAPTVIGVQREVVAQRRDGSTFPAELEISETRLDGERCFIGVLRDVSERRQTEQQLKAYFQALQDEQVLAKKLIEKQLHRPGLRDPLVQYSIVPATHFSGDVVAAMRAPDGKRYALLADATGHGLAAAISVLPLLALFYQMASQSRELSELVKELNQQLLESIPVGRFVAVTLVALNDAAGKGEIWVGGTPEVLLVDEWGRISQRFPSTHLPLGIVDNHTQGTAPSEFPWLPGNQLIMYSDGLIEAETEDGQPFGSEGLENALAHTSLAQRFQSVTRALGAHLGTGAAKDDISLLMLGRA